MYMKKIILLTLTLITFLFNLNAQVKPVYYIGGFADFNYNIHWADFRKLGDIPNCCPIFTSGTSYGFAAGGLFEYPIKDEILLGARVGFSSIGALLLYEETYVIGVYRGDSLEIEYVKIQTNFDSKLYIIGIEPYFNYLFLDDFCIYLGFNFSYILTGKIDKKEEIISPDSVKFSNGSVTRILFTNKDIPDKKSLLLFIVFGFDYEIPLSNNLILTPEIKYHLPLNNISGDYWKASVLQFGAAIKFPIY